MAERIQAHRAFDKEYQDFILLLGSCTLLCGTPLMRLPQPSDTFDKTTRQYAEMELPHQYFDATPSSHDFQIRRSNPRTADTSKYSISLAFAHS